MSWFGWMDLAALSPLVVLAVGAMLVLLADAFSRHARASYALPFTALGTILTAAVAVVAAWSEPRIAAGGSIATGPFAVYMSELILAASAVAVLYSVDFTKRYGLEYGEYYGLLLFSACGMLYLVAANDLISLFIAFELMSLAIYALVAVARTDARAGEGAMKYFVLGGFSSAFLLYGLTLLYGATGTIRMDLMATIAGQQGAAAATTPLVGAAIAMLFVAFAFKVGAVPFHAWIPDAYQGAPASVTGFMAVTVKAAAFAIFIKVLAVTGLLAAFAPRAETAGEALWLLAAATMVLGNFAALSQKSIQRLMAYSGIAHSGYVLLGLTAATRVPEAAAGALFYLVAYAAMTIGVFAVLTTLRKDGKPLEEIDDLAGLAQERPGAALAMTIFLCSFIGIPPTGGFIGKLWIFRSAVDAGYTGLVVIAVLTTLVSVYYYLRMIVAMYMGETAPATTPPSADTGFGGRFATVIAAVATVAFGVMPGSFLEGASSAVATLLGR